MEKKASGVAYFHEPLSPVRLFPLEYIRPAVDGQKISEKTVCVAKTGSQEYSWVILCIDYVVVRRPGATVDRGTLAYSTPSPRQRTVTVVQPPTQK
ncbi:hypothetical protein RvY_02580 [Ramazzottius varieornatus]|uniref:Uncharacterized protein n=1 Tax=Ramazzottius varieornatus TaxID=947166 RepID=A0A1D1UNY8_RAMVA|nr:hypothetical protein RvY_02580 [Ramazzottius varieornatus]